METSNGLLMSFCKVTGEQGVGEIVRGQDLIERQKIGSHGEL